MLRFRGIFVQRGEDEEEDAGDDEEKPLSNIMESAYFFEQAGVGLNREEMFRIFLSIKKLLVDKPLTACPLLGENFWFGAELFDR